MSNPVMGLDIGTTKICVIVGRKNEYGKLEVLGMGKAVSDGVIRGIVTNIEKTIKAIEKAVAEAEEQSGIDIRVVNVGIAGQHIKSSIHHGSITRDSADDEISVEDVIRDEDIRRQIHRRGRKCFAGRATYGDMDGLTILGQGDCLRLHNLQRRPNG